MSGEQSPLLGGALPAYEIFITQWQAIAYLSLHPQLRPFIEEGLSWAVTYHGRMQANNTYLFAMCTLHFTLSCFEANFTLLKLTLHSC